MKKGFTLIELLAVILILGIIALIAIPAVNNVIEDSKRNASEVTAMHYIKAINDQNALYKLQPDRFTPINSGDVDDIEVNLNGEGPTSGTVTIENGKVTEAEICANGYIVTYNGSKTTVEDKCSEQGQPRFKGLAKKVYDDALTNQGTIYNNPTLNKSFSDSSDLAGLYESSNTNSNKSTYYFRGNVTNNYVDFVGKTWRIVRINEDGTVRLVLDTGFTLNDGLGNLPSDKGPIYYSESTTITLLNEWYENNITGNNSLKVSTGDYFCEAARISYSSSSTINNVVFTPYTATNPTYVCETDANGYQYANSIIGLLSYDEVWFAGSYPTFSSGNNENYYLVGTAFMTMSPCDGKYKRVWMVKSNGQPRNPNQGTGEQLRPVINLKANVNATGKGTALEPYVVE